MADEAFALSPISARAAQPSEEDYDAISEAFLETSRGRWFLGEYAKRNRNADTRMVLDAVARIEQSLAAQKPPEPEPVPVIDSALPEAIEAIKAALAEARAFAAASVDGLAIEQHLAPVRKGARVIREISWRWREIGADSRICDLIDSQVGAIEASCGEFATVNPQSGLSAAFDLIGRQIAAFDDSEDAAEAAVHEAEPAVATVGATAKLNTEAAQASAEFAEPASQATAAAAHIEAEIATEAADAAESADALSDEAAEALDDAVLDLIAAEMSAADVSDAHLVDVDEPEVAEAPIAEPEPVAPIAAVTVAPVIEAPPPVALRPAPEPPAAPEPEPSIGSELVAGGLFKSAASDPLAALRRLSQAEKIALFS